MEDNRLLPYRVLFTLGVLSAALGAMLWIIFQSRMISFYPRSAHANLMYFGFLWSFVAGFLMTAMPRMTRTHVANTAEIFIACILVCIQWVLNIRNMIDFSVGVYSIQILFLAHFVFRRVLSSGAIPIEGFGFLVFGFVVPLVGVGRFYFLSDKNFPDLYLLAGEGLVLNMILALGCRMVPALIRASTAFAGVSTAFKNKVIELGLLAIIFNSTYLLDSISPRISYLIKGAVLLVVAIRHFRILDRPTSFSYVGWGIRIALASMMMGYFGLAYQGSDFLPLLHLIYIGGFSLISLMVGIRVTLAHGGQDIGLEATSKSIFLVLALVVIAAIARFWGGQDISGGLVAVAAYGLTTAVLIWLFKIHRN